MSIRGMTGALLLVITTMVTGAERDAGNVRETCLACLKTLQEQVQALIGKHPEELGHLGAGAIDEETLSVHFPVTDPRRWFRRYPGSTSAKQQEGIFFQFTHPIPCKPGAVPESIRWLCIDAEFAWSWGWARGPLTDAIRDDMRRAVHLALRLLDDAEAAALTADLARRNGESYVLRGRPGIELTARLEEERGVGGVHKIEFYETNRSGKPVALYPLCWEHTEVFEDGRPRPRARLPLMLRRIRGLGDPFIYLEPGERKRTFLWSRGKLLPGRYRFRFVIGHVRDGWTDATPTYHDGAPVYRRVENARLGVVVSNEMEFTVGEAPAEGDGGSRPADSRQP